jgi:hypothetical protein
MWHLDLTEPSRATLIVRDHYVASRWTEIAVGTVSRTGPHFRQDRRP